MVESMVITMDQCIALLQTAGIFKPCGDVLAHLNHFDWEPCNGYKWCEERSKASMIRTGVFAQFLFRVTSKVSMLQYQRWMIDEQMCTPHLISNSVDLTNEKMDKEDILSAAENKQTINNLINPTFHPQLIITITQKEDYDHFCESE